MARVRIGEKPIQVFYYLPFHGIQMDVTDQFLKVGVFLADNRFVPVLKELPVPLMGSVEVNCIAGKEPGHR